MNDNSPAPFGPFTCCAAALLCLCIAPVWLAPAVPMQDYPQHLFITAVLRGDLQPEWAEAYASQLTLAPYTGFYWVAYALTPFFGVDGAGRVFVSAYLLLFGVWLWRLGRELRSPPWAALTAFPFALSQTYFHGFLNYLFALPLLLLALHELRLAAAQHFGPARLALHALLLGAIAWFHPLCLYAYAGLGALDLLATRSAATPAYLRALPGALALIALAAWQSESYRDAEKLVWWAPLGDSLHYLALLFGGPRPEPAWMALHVACLLAIAAALVRSLSWRALDRRAGLQALAVLAAYLAVPFRIGSYTYVSWRLAPLFGLMLAALFARVPLPQRARWTVGLACGLLGVDLALLQLQVGQECAEIKPLIAKVERGARVTAINFAVGSRYLNPQYFGLMHEHEIFYYPLAAGGLSPFLWSDPLIPIRKRASFTLTRPGSLQALLAQHYRVVFSRGASPELVRTLQPAYELRGQNGAWSVFQRR